ncbi:hypothetical protein LPJGGPFB_04001 [Ensifer adhaerens]|uniref:Uncharacterized protein n=1 Tax=Ensifer adhaerens TaxID=106592 RepID=A0ACC5T2V4_ENSAD|nr:hypothetical protein [Ensifer adhaerens]NRP20742.1 hypothetical protein [Ensifer adhaerens]
MPSGSAPDNVKASVWQNPRMRDPHQDFAFLRRSDIKLHNFQWFARRKCDSGT